MAMTQQRQGWVAERRRGPGKGGRKTAAAGGAAVLATMAAGAAPWAGCKQAQVLLNVPSLLRQNTAIALIAAHSFSCPRATYIYHHVFELWWILYAT